MLPRKGFWGTGNRVGLTLMATCILALAAVQTALGAGHWVWILGACGALWALLVQASHANPPARPVRVRLDVRRHSRPHRW